MNFLKQNILYSLTKLRGPGRVALILGILSLMGGTAFAAVPPAEAPADVMITQDDMFWVKVIGICLIIMVLMLAWITLVVTVKDPAKISVQSVLDEFTSKNLVAPEMHHEYDGIRELDNPMPAWLRIGFIGSIIFGFIYVIYYHFTDFGQLQAAEYEAEVKWAEMTYKDSELPDEAIKIVTDEGALTTAKAKFGELCAPCHMADGGGDVGPNLTDKYWLHGGSVVDIYHTITNGVPDKGMISWKKFLTSRERLAVASYILSFQGTTPAKAKAPQGVIWTEEGGGNAVPDSTDTDSGQADQVSESSNAGDSESTKPIE